MKRYEARCNFKYCGLKDQLMVGLLYSEHTPLIHSRVTSIILNANVNGLIPLLIRALLPSRYKPAAVINRPETDETTVIFFFLICQYVSLSVTLSTGPPYRKPLYTNGQSLIAATPYTLHPTYHYTHIHVHTMQMRVPFYAVPMAFLHSYICTVSSGDRPMQCIYCTGASGLGTRAMEASADEALLLPVV